MSQTLQWYVVRVLLQGPTQQACVEAIEDLRAWLLDRSYLRNPVVIWHTAPDGLVFQIEVEFGNAAAAEGFVYDEVFEAAGAILPMTEEYRVTVLGNEPI